MSEIEQPTLPHIPDSEWDLRSLQLSQERARNEAQATKDRVAALLHAGFPIRALEAAQAAEETSLIREVRNWASQRNRNVLVLSGKTGTGKTVAASHFALSIPNTAYFMRASDYVASGEYRDERRKWVKASVLVCDDLGAERGTGDWDALFDKFYGDRRRLVITTNCNGDEFEQRYGGRVIDRFRECGKWVLVKGESMRGRQMEIDKCG